MEKIRLGIIGCGGMGRSHQAGMKELEDICTINEIHAIAQRLQVAKLLSEGKTYSEIENVTKASTATISRINKCLVYGAEGYQRILERMKDSE